LSHSLEEFTLLPLESVRFSTAGALTPEIDRHIEQDRKIGLKSPLNPVLQYLQPPLVNASAISLIGIRGIREAIAQHDLAFRKRGKNDPGEMLAARRKDEKRLRLRMHRLLGM
jgi:hypothetical protein